VQEVPGSDPGSPTNFFNQMREIATAPAKPAVDDFVHGGAKLMQADPNARRSPRATLPICVCWRRGWPNEG
jgi:hypothetical protein